MNSSTSSSDEPRWRGFILTFIGTALVLFATVFFASAALDPFDAGMFGEPFRGVASQGQRTADASRLRNPAFTGAIFGNSHIQLVDPDILRTMTGIPTVSLVVPGTGPREQLVMLDAFLRHHAEAPDALVFGIDSGWCTADPTLPTSNPFPFWLYDADPLVYLRGLARYSTLEHVAQRLGLTFGRNRLARQDGYSDYAAEKTHKASEPSGPVSTLPNETGRYPALALLAQRLRKLPPKTTVVIVRPPVHVSSLPSAGSAMELSERNCLAATRDLLSDHGPSGLVDFRSDTPAAREGALWFDETHYDRPLARSLERAIADQILALRR